MGNENERRRRRDVLDTIAGEASKDIIIIKKEGMAAALHE